MPGGPSRASRGSGRRRQGRPPGRGEARRDPADPGLGQHFLRSAALARRIVADAGIETSDVVVEPGAGYGVLTAAIAARAAAVVAIEIDPRCTERLTRTSAANVLVVQTDATQPRSAFRRGRRLPAAVFRPAPAVDAAMLAVARRAAPMLEPAALTEHAAFVRAEHAGGRHAVTGVDARVERFLSRRAQ